MRVDPAHAGMSPTLMIYANGAVMLIPFSIALECAVFFARSYGFFFFSIKFYNRNKRRKDNGEKEKYPLVGKCHCLYHGRDSASLSAMRKHGYRNHCPAGRQEIHHPGLQKVWRLETF